MTTAAAHSDLEDLGERLRAACVDAGALLVPGEVVGAGLLVQIGPEHADVLVELIRRSQPGLLYVNEERFDTETYNAELSIVDAATVVLDAAPQRDDDEPDDEFFDAAAFAELTAAVTAAGKAAEAALKCSRQHLGGLGSVVLSVVAGGVHHSVSLTAPWRESVVAALLDLDDALALWQDPAARQISGAEQESSWARREEQRQAEQQAHDQEVADAGRRLLDVLITDQSFRSTRAEPVAMATCPGAAAADHDVAGAVAVRPGCVSSGRTRGGGPASHRGRRQAA